MNDAISYTTSTYEPPFPYFGGKSVVALEVWAGICHVDNFIEPFFGSGAVMGAGCK